MDQMKLNEMMKIKD